MIDLSKLKLVQKGFVGLTAEGELSLPKGVALHDAYTPSYTLQWLGQLLKLLLLHQLQTANGNKAGREGVAEPEAAKEAIEGGSGFNASGGITSLDERSDELPSHFGQWKAVIEMLLARANDPVVFAVQRRIIHSEEILYSQLHRHLHDAVFAEDDVIMLERMPRAGMRGRFEASDMIGLLCWLAQDVVEKLNLGVFLPENVHGLAEDFADRHLHHDASLFCGDTQATLDDLRTTFEELRRYHPPVDADTEDIIEVIENYLYAGKKIDPSLKTVQQSKDGKSGAQPIENVLFGSQFFDVWEMLCLHHAYENDINDGWKVLIADGGNLPKWLRENEAFKDNLVDNTTYQGGPAFFFGHSIDKLGQRPDLILYQVDQNTINYRVIDFKYYEWDDLRAPLDMDKLNPSEKKFFLGVIKDGLLNLSSSDIAKSWGYAQSTLCWHNEKMLGKKISIRMEFWLPSDNELSERPYSMGALYPKPICLMIDELLNKSPNLWLEH